MPAITCRNCSRTNLSGKRFCVDCGQRLDPPCRACGAPVEPDERFCGNCGARLEPPAPGLRDAQPDLPAGGERRQLTVLFADLVGSTRMATSLDPEEYHQVIRSYHQAVARVVQRFDGYVAQYQGDGIVAYFGWPLAHDDDAERAIRAGLEIIDTVRGLTRGRPGATPLAVRAGIDTGPVMVGHLGGGERREITAIGETPNVAARAQAAAPPGGLVVTAATNRLAAGLFAVDPMGPQELKGVAQPVQLFRVMRATGVRGRLHLAHSLTPFIGRDHELRTIRDRWDRAAAGEGQVVVIRGESGIGKSRLALQFRQALGAQPHSWLESFCSSIDLNTPFAPGINLITSSFIWGANDAAPADRLGALEQSLRDAGLKLDEAVPLLAEMLSLPLPDRYQPSLAPPDQQRRRLIAVLVQWTFALARLQPLVLFLDDLQWADPSTLELNQALVAQCADLPVMLLYTARPEFIAPWPLHFNHCDLTLTRLSSADTREMARLAVIRALSDRTLDLVAERTDGVPLFVEELARVVAETDGADATGQQIPVTLADSLMARLDRLGPAREIAQIAAVVGRGFSYDLLREVAGRPDDELRAALDRVLDAELIVAAGSQSDATYAFKHVMVRDTAYGSLLKSRRRELHRAVAAALTAKFAPQAEADPALLAYHLTEAGEADRAAAAWQLAADRSAARGAFAEAANHYSRALEVLRTTPESDRRDQHELALLVALGSALTPARGLASDEVEAIFLRARALGERLGRVRSATILGLWQTYLTRGKLAAAQALAEQRLEIARGEGAPLSLCWGHFALGATLMHRGMLSNSLTHLRAAVDHSHNRDAPTRPFDAGLLAMSYLAVALHLTGLPDQANEIAMRTMRTAEELAKPSNIAFCAVNVAAMHQLSFNPAAALDIARYAAPVARSHGVAQLASALDVYAGWAVAAGGDPRSGADQIRRGIAEWLANGQRLPHAWYLSMLAWTYALDQRFEQAADTLADADAAIGELHMEAPILAWTRADILRMSGAAHATLESAWRAAIDSARTLAMPLFELRASVGLARLLADRGQPAAARALLADACAPFTEGAATFDLTAAHTLLSSLPS